MKVAFRASKYGYTIQSFQEYRKHVEGRSLIMIKISGE